MFFGYWRTTQKDWRDANISSIFKKGDKHLPENYRPVSLTPVTCKSLFVGLVKTDLNWFNNNSAFPLLSLMRFVPFFSGAIPPDS
jgi:hypothetical protein